MADDGLERFRTGSAVVLGYIGVLVGLGGMALIIMDGYSGGEWWPLCLCLLGATLSWAVLVRPVVLMGRDELILRGVLSDLALPLAAVEIARVTLFLNVRAGGRTYTSAALGRSRRKLHTHNPDDPATLEADVIEVRINAAADNARARAGIAAHSDEQVALAAGVRRTWAWPVIAVVATLLLAVVIGAAL